MTSEEELYMLPGRSVLYTKEDVIYLEDFCGVKGFVPVEGKKRRNMKSDSRVDDIFSAGFAKGQDDYKNKKQYEEGIAATFFGSPGDNYLFHQGYNAGWTSAWEQEVASELDDKEADSGRKVYLQPGDRIMIMWPVFGPNGETLVPARTEVTVVELGYETVKKIRTDDGQGFQVSFWPEDWHKIEKSAKRPGGMSVAKSAVAAKEPQSDESIEFLYSEATKVADVIDPAFEDGFNRGFRAQLDGEKLETVKSEEGPQVVGEERSAWENGLYAGFEASKDAEDEASYDARKWIAKSDPQKGIVSYINRIVKGE